MKIAESDGNAPAPFDAKTQRLDCRLRMVTIWDCYGWFQSDATSNADYTAAFSLTLKNCRKIE